MFIGFRSTNLQVSTGTRFFFNRGMISYFKRSFGEENMFDIFWQAEKFCFLDILSLKMTELKFSLLS